MMDNIDFDTSALVFAEKQIGELGEELYTEMLKVLNGKTYEARSAWYYRNGNRKTM